MFGLDVFIHQSHKTLASILDESYLDMEKDLQKPLTV